MKNYLALFLILILPAVASAQIEISEIMYDLDGGDTGREWIELHNAGAETIDLYGWKFYEADSNHGLYIEKSGELIGIGSIIEPDAYIIISNLIDNFRLDYPTYSNIVYYSSFSLLNGGELLGIRDSDLVDIDLLTYSPEWSASGKGDSLQKINGEWVASLPTPGLVNVFNVTAVSDSDDANESGDTTQSSSDDEVVQNSPNLTLTPTIDYPIYVDTSENIIASAGPKERTVLVGTIVDLKGSVTGMPENWARTARYSWTLGDGGKKSGQEAEYTYYYEGRYPVTLVVSSGEYIAHDRVIIQVISSKVVIDSVEEGKEGYVRLYNESAYDIDLRGWKIFDGEKSFAIPEYTFILKKDYLTLSNIRLRLDLETGKEVVFSLPIGTVVDTFKITEVVEEVDNKEVEEIQDVIIKKVPIVVPLPIVQKKDTVTEVYKDESLHIPVIEKHAELIEENAEEVVIEQKKEVKPLTATAFNTQSRVEESPIFWYLMGVFALVLVAMYGILISRDRKVQEEMSLREKRVDEFEIIEQ